MSEQANHDFTEGVKSQMSTLDTARLRALLADAETHRICIRECTRTDEARAYLVDALPALLADAERLQRVRGLLGKMEQGRVKAAVREDGEAVISVRHAVQMLRVALA